MGMINVGNYLAIPIPQSGRALWELPGPVMDTVSKRGDGTRIEDTVETHQIALAARVV